MLFIYLYSHLIILIVDLLLTLSTRSFDDFLQQVLPNFNPDTRISFSPHHRKGTSCDDCKEYEVDED
jgi:hypothetical protein